MPDFDGPWGSLEPAPPPPPPRRWRQDRRVRLAIGLAVAGLIGLGVWGLTRLFPGQLMSGDDWSTISFRIGFIVLVSLSLFSRRLRLGEVVRYIAIWAAVFGVLAIGYAYRGEIIETGLRVRSELLPGYATPTGPHEVVLSQDSGGGYSVIGEADGKPVRFAVDTGASDIVLTPADAARLGVDLSRLDYARHFETANGVGDGAAYSLSSLVVGPIRLTDVPVSINRAPMSTSLLGMAFLKRMQSFEVKDGRLYLRWTG
jgi:aspartyl protease family protein